MADWSRRVTASQPRYPFFLSSTYLSQRTPIHPTNPVLSSNPHPSNHDAITSPQRTRSRSFSSFFVLLALFFKTFTLRFPPCFSIISPFVQRLSIIFGCSVRALVIHVSLASARPCDKYNRCPSSLFPSSILTPSSVSSPSLNSSHGHGRR